MRELFDDTGWVCNTSLLFEVHSLTLTDAAGGALYWQMHGLAYCIVFGFAIKGRFDVILEAERNEDGYAL